MVIFNVLQLILLRHSGQLNLFVKLQLNVFVQFIQNICLQGVTTISFKSSKQIIHGSATLSFKNSLLLNNAI